MLVIAILALYFRHSLLAEGLPAIAVQVLAALLMLWGRLVFGRRSFHAAANPTEGGLVTTGPYRMLRHPIYASVLYFLWAGALSHLSAVNGSLAAVATAALVARIYSEERLVVQRYPEYRDYAAKTKRLIPFLF